MKTLEVRDRFVEYYQSLGYDVLPRAPMLDDSIPMSFVMSAGLVQVEKSLAKMQVRDKDKFVLVQDCFRHFDLERVGTDDIHLSIFKMPGAFKFGPNGKTEAVERMWHLATHVLGIDEEKIWASYFVGGSVEGKDFPSETSIKRAWEKVGLPNQRIVGLGRKDNFWLQGKGFDGKDEPRRSGPNTELFYDRGLDKACSLNCKPGCKCGRFIEFSNSLFIRYEIDDATNEFRQLEDPFSETVIGAERVAMILQAKDSVFEIASYAPLMRLIRQFSNSHPLEGNLLQIGERRIADHLRALVFLIGDDAPPPGKNGRQRLIKKLIRGLITGMQLLEISDLEFLPLALHEVISSVDDLPISADQIEERFFTYYGMQEDTFLATIDRGQKKLTQYLGNNGKSSITGEQIVFLEKKIGFPYLLITSELVRKKIPVPKADYMSALQSWKNSNI